VGTDILIPSEHVHYVGGYKYQTRKDFIIKTIITPPADIATDLIVLKSNGWLWIGKYFAWDGCSGPTWDDSTNMRAGLVHDALYALMRMGLLDLKWRPYADRLLWSLMIQDGALRQRADYYKFAVNKFAKYAADPKNARLVQVAPRR
jgi:hypothetical protein